MTHEKLTIPLLALTVRRVTSRESRWIYLSVSATLASTCLCKTGPGGFACCPTLQRHIMHSVLRFSCILVSGATSNSLPISDPIFLDSYFSTTRVFERSDPGLLLSLSPLTTVISSFFLALLLTPVSFPSSSEFPLNCLTYVLTWCVTGSSNPACHVRKHSSFLGPAQTPQLCNSKSHSGAPVRPRSHSQVHPSATLSPDWVRFCLHFCSYSSLTFGNSYRLLHTVAHSIFLSALRFYKRTSHAIVGLRGGQTSMTPGSGLLLLPMQLCFLSVSFHNIPLRLEKRILLYKKVRESILLLAFQLLGFSPSTLYFKYKRSF